MELTTGVFLHEIGQRLQDFSWVRACTACADDIHGGDLVSTPQQLDALLCKIGHLFDVLVDASLKINAIKSAFLIRFTSGLTHCPE